MSFIYVQSWSLTNISIQNLLFYLDRNRLCYWKFNLNTIQNKHALLTMLYCVMNQLGQTPQYLQIVISMKVLSLLPKQSFTEHVVCTKNYLPPIIIIIVYNVIYIIVALTELNSFENKR